MAGRPRAVLYILDSRVWRTMDEQVSMRLPDRQYADRGDPRLHAGVLVFTFMLHSMAILLAVTSNLAKAVSYGGLPRDIVEQAESRKIGHGRRLRSRT